eukprot:TRINITY_DN716_c0_g1_i1.p1 TRINITY_DN716_c0_g1~~TRINITY_DN716_c0_g1_i1.p1  ORF type:complete len:717 (+),score=139.55 TRINITY_DN716_c0_g1_i1:3-2153(+)
MQSLFPKTYKELEEIKSWKRISDFGPDASLFKNGAEEGDIIQGELGDCWFLSALSVLASRGTSALQDLFVAVHPAEGFVQCKFFKNNKWVFVTIDDRIPCNEEGLPCFGRCKDPNELWVPLIEKCYAKLHGSFEVLESGSIIDALVDFTGETSEVVMIKKETAFWKKIVENAKSQYLMGCAAQMPGASVEDASPLGILQLHAYAIIKIVEVSGYKLIQLRNPWGQYEWTGKWSDGSKEWTPSLLKELDYTFADDGTFWMEFSDFCANFTKLYVLRCFSTLKQSWSCFSDKGMWKKKTSGGCLSNTTWNINPQYYIKASQDTQVFISLKQPDQRIKGTDKERYQPFGITALLKGDGNSIKKKVKLNGKSDLVAMSSFYGGREVSLEWTATGGIDYVFIPSFFASGIESEYWINIYTYPVADIKKIKSKPEVKKNTQSQQQGTILTPVSQDVNLLTVKSAWIKGKSAGGCPNYASWTSSPQLILTVPKNEVVEISLRNLTATPSGKYAPFGFFVFKSEPAKKRKFAASDVVHQSKFITSEVNASAIPLAPGSYNILCCTLNPDVEANFELSVKGSFQDISQLFELNPTNDWLKILTEGKWIPGLDGGSGNNKDTWMKNPRFQLVVTTPKTNVKLVITSQINGAVGFYVFTSKDGKNVTQLLDKSPFGKCSATGHAMSSQNLTLDSGRYIVMATTFQPKCHASFTLAAYTDNNCTLQPI